MMGTGVLWRQRPRRVRVGTGPVALTCDLHCGTHGRHPRSHSCRGAHDVHHHQHRRAGQLFLGLCDACSSIAGFAVAVATNHLACCSVWVSLPSLSG